MHGKKPGKHSLIFICFTWIATVHTVKFYVKIEHVHRLPWWHSILRCAISGEYVFMLGLKQPPKNVLKSFFSSSWLLLRSILGHCSSTIRLQPHFSFTKLLVTESEIFRACLVSSVSSSVAASFPATLIL
jgi:hypothetical protein